MKEANDVTSAIGFKRQQFELGNWVLFKDVQHQASKSS
jgi:hypothetical protein